MQILLEGKQIEEQITKDFLLEIQAGKYCRAILESARECPKSAKQLRSLSLFFESMFLMSNFYRSELKYLNPVRHQKLFRITVLVVFAILFL